MKLTAAVTDACVEMYQRHIVQISDGMSDMKLSTKFVGIRFRVPDEGDVDAKCPLPHI